MKKRLVLGLKEHHILGYILAPYLIYKRRESDFKSIIEQVIENDIDNLEEFSNKEKEIVKLSDQYSDKNLFKHFDNKSTNIKMFYKKLEDEKLQKHIRPYIERKMINMLNIALEVGIQIFHKNEKFSNLYSSDEIKMHKKAASAVFNFKKHENGCQYFLSIKHEGNEIKLIHCKAIILCNSPCILIIRNELFFFKNIDGNKLKPFFSKEFVEIPKSSEKKYFETFVLNAVKNHKVKPEGFSITKQSPKPNPIFILDEILNGKLLFILKFDYQNQFFLYKDNEDVFVKTNLSENNFDFIKIFRDSEKEEFFANELKELGLVYKENGNWTLENSKSNYDLINWLNNSSNLLKTKGFFVENNFRDKNYFTEKINLDIKIESKKDWFDIYAKVYFGKFEIPFVKLKNYIINGIREYQLPNGEIAILPEEWFSKYREWLAFGNVIMGHIHLDNKYFSFIENTEDLIASDNSYVESLKNLFSRNWEEKIQPPKNLNAKLRNYQQKGVEWMYALHENNFGGCLADDMGLGKTLQTITLLLKAKENYIQKHKNILIEKESSTSETPNLFENIEKKEIKPPASLIVMPVSLIQNWASEIRKFSKNLKIYKHIGSDRTKVVKAFDKYDVILTSYGTIRNDFAKLVDYQFFYIVLDESQYIKNSESKTYHAVNSLNSSHRLVLSGTPIENSLTDLWSQMNFLNEGLLGNLEFFKQEYVAPIEKSGNENQRDKLSKLIQPFLLRRTKGEVAKDLPALSEQLVSCEMTKEQEKFYEKEKSRIRNSILEEMKEEGQEKWSFLALQGLMRLRQIANHPLLIDEKSELKSGKFELIKQKLENLISGNHKVLIFSSFVKHLSLFENLFKEKKWKFSKITGKVSRTQREKEIAVFQKDKKTNIFLISLKAGGTGLNLTAADYVFILDPWWNPAVENQAINRAHRIGQDKNVFVYRFITDKSIEGKIQKIKEQKSALAQDFINSNNPFKALSTESIIDLFE